MAKDKKKLELGKQPSNYQLLINPGPDPNLLREAAAANNYSAFINELPEALHEASDVFYNFYRAKHILEQNTLNSLQEECKCEGDCECGEKAVLAHQKKYHKLVQRTRKIIDERFEGNVPKIELEEDVYSADKKRVLIRTSSGKYVWRNIKVRRKIIDTNKQPAHQRSKAYNAY